MTGTFAQQLHAAATHRAATAPMPFKRTDGGRATAGRVNGNVGDCAIRAITIATTRPYGEVFTDMQAQYRHWVFNSNDALARDIKVFVKYGYIDFCMLEHGTPNAFIHHYLTQLGWMWTSTRGRGVLMQASHMPAGRVIVALSKHLTTVVDGVLHDTHDCSKGGAAIVHGHWLKQADITRLEDNLAAHRAEVSSYSPLPQSEDPPPDKRKPAAEGSAAAGFSQHQSST